MRNLTVVVAAVGAVLWCGCGTTDGGSSSSSSSGAACDANAAAYVPFDAANLTSVQAEVDALNQIVTLRKTMTFSKADFAQLNTLYTTTLATPVQGLTPLPPTEPAGVGAAIHARVTDALARGADAQDTLPIGGLAQVIEKNLLRYMALRVWAETHATQNPQAGWDRAVAYFGTGLDGSGNTSIGSTLKGRDTNYALMLHNTAFRALVSGRCAVAGNDAAALETARTAVESNIRLGLAYGAARYFKTVAEGDLDWGELMEGAAFFDGVEGHLRTVNASGAQAIRTWLDPLLPGGANAGMMPDTANAAASLTTLRTAYSLTL